MSASNNFDGVFFPLPVLDDANHSRSCQYRCFAADGGVYIYRESVTLQGAQQRSIAGGGKRRRRTAAAISSGLASSVEKILR